MKNVIWITMIVFSIANNANAYGNMSDTLTLSLTQAQQLGLKNRYDVKSNSYDVAIAEKEMANKKQGYLPNVRAVGNMQYRPQIQSTLIPSGFAGLTQPQILALGAKSVSTFGLELNQVIYNPSLRLDIEDSKNAVVLQNEKKRGNEIEIKKNISLAYLNALLRGLQLTIAQQEQNRYLDYYQISEGRFKNGALIENDLLRAKLDYENAMQQTAISEQNYLQSKATLCYQLNIPTETSLKLTDHFNGLGQDNTIMTDINGSGENRTELQQLKLQQKSYALQELKQRRATLPTISLTGNYAYQYLNEGFYHEFVKSKRWLPYSAIGINITLPITGQFTNRTLSDKARLRTLQVQEDKKQLIADINYQVSQATTDFGNALKNLSTTQSSYKLAQQIYENEKNQLALGALTYDILLNTEASLNKAEGNYISAVYQYMTAKLNYDVALGRL